MMDDLAEHRWRPLLPDVAPGGHVTVNGMPRSVPEVCVRCLVRGDSPAADEPCDRAAERQSD